MNATPSFLAGSLAGLPITPERHFRVHGLAAAEAVLRFVRDLDTVLPEAERIEPRFPFLKGYEDELHRLHAGNALAAEIRAWESRSPVRLPLKSAERDAGLEWAQRLAFVLIGLVEEDARFGALFADVQGEAGSRRPTLELVGRMVAGELAVDPWRVIRPLLDDGFVAVQNPKAPRSGWTLRVPEILWDVIRGDASVRMPWGAVRMRRDAPVFEALIVPEGFRQRVERVPELLRRQPKATVVIRGGPGSDGESVAAAIAGALGHDVLQVDATHLDEQKAILGPLCTLLGAIPVVRYDLGPGESVARPTCPGYHGPILLLLGTEGGFQAREADPVMTLTMPALGPAERLRGWQAAFNGQAVLDLEVIVERFHLPGATIRQVAGGAVRQAALLGQDAVRMADVRTAQRVVNREQLDTLAEPIDVDAWAEGSRDPWSHLVASERAHAKLYELERRCRHRERLAAHLGPAFGVSGNRGVRALFTGPSGTGKTLAARLMAARLGMDLYRVDLAAVVNKYIGETEKNLHRVLSAAEALDVVLLLDEGDALLGGRTEQRTANDRYANLETNYLLQRLEHYQGIVLVTTNLGENIDRAFQRRMDVMVDFLPPQTNERRAIWALHLPHTHQVADAVLDAVATRCALTGGQIRNAAHLATLLALDERTPVRAGHVHAALQSEYHKAGATCPLDAVTPVGRRTGQVHAFLDALAP